MVERDYKRRMLRRACRDAIFLRSLAICIPNGLIAAAMSQWYWNYEDISESSVLGVSQVWSGYNFVLGFLVVFRTQHAYSRFWEGASLLQQMRGEWFNAISSLFAFCASGSEKRREVEHFHNLVVRLASMLHCAALQQVSVMEVQDFATLDVEGMEPEALRFLQLKAEKCEVLLQWIQRLIVEAANTGVLPIPPPILSRAFQELSRGIVILNNARKITDIPFPRPYGQLINLMLYIQFLVTPVVCSLLMPSWNWAGGLSAITIFCFLSTVSIAAEIENPFGDDPNDLPLAEFQRSFNQSLLTLLERQAQVPPAYVFKKSGQRVLSMDLGWLSPAVDDDHPNKRRQSLLSQLDWFIEDRASKRYSPKGSNRNSLVSANTIQSAEKEAKFHEELPVIEETLSREGKHEAKATESAKGPSSWETPPAALAARSPPEPLPPYASISRSPPRSPARSPSPPCARERSVELSRRRVSEAEDISDEIAEEVATGFFRCAIPEYQSVANTHGQLPASSVEVASPAKGAAAKVPISCRVPPRHAPSQQQRHSESLPRMGPAASIAIEVE